MILSPNLPWNLANPKWAATLNPIIANPLTNITILSQALVSGVNVINTGLQQIQRGWIILDIDAPITIYRSAPFNSTTLSLTCSGPANASIGVF